MAECEACSRDLNDGTLWWKGTAWKSCPKCSEGARVHVFLRFPEDFGTRPSATEPGKRIPQSRCYFHRDMGEAAASCRLCGSLAVVPYKQIIEGARTSAHTVERPEPVLTPEQLDALASALVGGIEFSPEGRKFLRKHVATERSPKNREFILKLRGKDLTCDGCGVDLAEVYGAMHRRVIEVHHVRPLARGPQQAKGTADFNVLCPTCHRVIHYQREEPLRIEKLRDLLAENSEGTLRGGRRPDGDLRDKLVNPRPKRPVGKGL